jgi:hypothetical protein
MDRTIPLSRDPYQDYWVLSRRVRIPCTHADLRPLALRRDTPAEDPERPVTPPRYTAPRPLQTSPSGARRPRNPVAAPCFLPRGPVAPPCS